MFATFQYQKYSVVLKLMELFFICISELFRCYFDFFLSSFDIFFYVLSFYIMSFLYFCFSMFCRSMFCHKYLFVYPVLVALDIVFMLYIFAPLTVYAIVSCC